jgi:hypothetical protein
MHAGLLKPVVHDAGAPTASASNHGHVQTAEELPRLLFFADDPSNHMTVQNMASNCTQDPCT